MVIQGVSPLKNSFSINLYNPLLTRFNGSPFGRENLPQTPYNRNNIIVKLSDKALNRLDEIGYSLVKKYRLAGYTQERIRVVALSHLLEAV